MEKQNLFGLTTPQLEQAMIDLNEKPFRGRQLFRWLYNLRQNDFDLMTDLSKGLRDQLAEKYEIRGLTLTKRSESVDGTVKYLFSLPDARPVESVLIPDGDRKTVCISSQSGCALACRFCATGTLGLLRDLTAGEIVGQLTHIRDERGEDAFTNVVFMGMGEPLNNFQTVLNAIDIMTSSDGLDMSPKRITISTSGITPKIRKLADDEAKTRLALSLHAATQEKRRRIMPVAETFGLDKLMDTVRYYAHKTGQRITFEYILFDGFNDTADDARQLVRLLHGLPCNVNLLAYNPVDGFDHKRPSSDRVDWFAQQLVGKIPAVTVRQSRGLDIDAACGQLAAKEMKGHA